MPPHLAGASAIDTAATDGPAAIPTLVVGTARGSLWLCGPAGSTEVTGGHFDQPSCVAPHPLDSASWATCGRDGQLLLWTAPHAAPRCRALLPSAANCLAFSEDGRFIATGHADGTVRVHRTPPMPWRPPDPFGRRGVRMELIAVSGAPAESAVASARQPGELETVAFSANGSSSALLACGGHDKTVRVLELRFGSSHMAGGAGGGGGKGVGGVKGGGGRGLGALASTAQASERGRGHDSCAVKPFELSDGSIQPQRNDSSLTHELGGTLVPRCCCRGHSHTVLQIDFNADGAMRRFDPSLGPLETLAAASLRVCLTATRLTLPPLAPLAPPPLPRLGDDEQLRGP